MSRIIHTIHMVPDITAARLLYLDALGGLIFSENYFPAEDRDAILLYVTDHMVEPMAPRTLGAADKGPARHLARCGPGYHSFELGVADGRAASAYIRSRGAAVAGDYGGFFFVKGDSTGGVLLEVCELPMPNDPYDRGQWEPAVGTGHACSVVRLDHIACVVADIEAALRFFTGIVDGELVEDERTARPQPGRRAVIRLGGTRIAFIQPDDGAAGPLGAFLARPQSGIYALVWQVADPEQARAHFAGTLSLRLTEEGCVAPGFAIDPRDFLGARHEFVAG
ncbi:MAG: VOC family protein [Novosphingobium sp.]